MSNQFGLSHIKQLTEIQDTRNRRGQPGIGPEVEELIRRLTSGGVAGKTDDVRIVQAKRFWDLGIGRALGKDDFEAYLATIPEIPTELVQDDADYPLLVLVEPRLGLKRLCDLGSVEFSGDDKRFIEHDARHRELMEPTWICAQDGRKNRNRAVRDCRASFAKDELGLTALQGVCTYLQHPESVSDTDRESGHIMDLSGPVLRVVRESAATLWLRSGRAMLGWRLDGEARPKYGSASRRECKAL